MHKLVLATFDLKYADTSGEARYYAVKTLMDEGFCHEGRFSSAWSDWFVIGGRWTGHLLAPSKEREQGRSEYNQYGSDDDALIVTEELYNQWLKEYEGLNEQHGKYVDFEWEDVSPAFIGSKWLIAIDCHN